MPYKSYRDLDIYTLAKRLAIAIHKISMKLPRFELYEGGSQIRRSSKSIVSNIVEGFGRRKYKQEFIRFLIFALASRDETIEHLDMLHKTKSLSDDKTYEACYAEYVKLGRMINSFLKSVQKNHRTK